MENIIKFKTELLKTFVETLKQNGFKVYIRKDLKQNEKITYIHFEKDNKIGYIENNYFSGLNFSTIHKPSKEHGTGYRVHDGIIEPTINHALDCFCVVPRWSRDHKNNIKKYNSFKDYNENSIFKNSYEEFIK